MVGKDFPNCAECEPDCFKCVSSGDRVSVKLKTMEVSRNKELLTSFRCVNEYPQKNPCVSKCCFYLAL